jgi:hypothetical protein
MRASAYGATRWLLLEIRQEYRYLAGKAHLFFHHREGRWTGCDFHSCGQGDHVDLKFRIGAIGYDPSQVLIAFGHGHRCSWDKHEATLLLKKKEISLVKSRLRRGRKFQMPKSPGGAPRAGARGTCGRAEPAEAPVLLRQGFGGHSHSCTVGRPWLPAKAGEIVLTQFHGAGKCQMNCGNENLTEQYRIDGPLVPMIAPV